MGGLPLRNTHTWLWACTHIHTHTLSHPNDCTHRHCVRLEKQPQRHKDTKTGEETHKDSHSQTEAHKQMQNPTCQACGKGLSRNNESYTDTLLLEPLNVSFFLFEDMPAVPDSSWCFHIEHNVSLMPLTH